MNNWPRILGYTLAIGFVAGAAYFAMRETPVKVDVAEASRGSMQVTINEEGVTRVRNVYQVFPPITGHLDRVELEEGDEVVANETVISRIHPIDPPFIDTRTASEIAAAVEAARSSVILAEVNLSKAEAELSLAETEFQRSNELQRNEVVSQAVLDKKFNIVLLKRAEVDAAKAAIELRKAELKRVEARRLQPTANNVKRDTPDCCVEIRAPVSGTVLKVNHKSEQVILSTMPIMDIGNPQDLEIAVDLLSSDAVKIKPRSAVTISEWGGETPLNAVVRRIDPAGFLKVSALGIEEQRVNVVLDMESVPSQLGHGYRVFANFVIWASKDTLQVPIGALFRKNGKWSAFLLEGERVTVQPLEIGKMNDTHAEVLDGLANGDLVVLYPNDQLVEGSLIEVR